MKKIKLFSLVAATLFAGSTMAAAFTPTTKVDTIMLTKTNIEASDYLSASTNNWATGKDYGKSLGVASADYYNMSKAERYITISLSGVESFVVLVYNSTNGRNYTIQIGTSTEKITHGGNALEVSSLISTNSSGEVSVKIGGDNGSVYPVAIVVNKAPEKDDATLKSITVNDKEVEGFAPETTTYNVELPFNTTKVPVVAATATSAKATVAVTQAETVEGTASILVTAEDNTTTKTYTVSFTVAKAQSTDATLASISIDGTAIADFKADSLNYTHTIAYTATTIPVIAAEANDASASVSITPADAVPGTATIVVTAQAGNKQTYTVAINRAAAIKHLTVVPFTNGAKGAIDETALTVTAPYLDGTDVPTVDGERIAVSGDGTPTATLSEDGATITLKGADDVEANYTVVTKALTPETLTADVITFTGEETYIYAPYGWASDKGIKFAKKVNDEANMRDAKGNTRIYMALPPAENVILTSGSGGARAVVITVNGVASTVKETAASGKTITIALNQSTNNFVAIESNQTDGDGGFTKMQLTSPKDPVGAALNQVQAEVKAVKVIRDGQLLIIREGKTYTAQGVELQ